MEIFIKSIFTLMSILSTCFSNGYIPLRLFLFKIILKLAMTKRHFEQVIVIGNVREKGLLYVICKCR